MICADWAAVTVKLICPCVPDAVDPILIWSVLPMTLGLEYSNFLDWIASNKTTLIEST